MNLNFIKQTAYDYNMSEDQVKDIYNRYFLKGKFYDELEKFIQTRRQLK